MLFSFLGFFLVVPFKQGSKTQPTNSDLSLIYQTYNF